MIKKDLNQNDIYVHELIDTIEPNFVFNDKPINRLKLLKIKKITFLEISKKNYLILEIKLIQLKIVI